MQSNFPTLILGGTGVFGSRLARMLIEDGWPVTVTSRSLSRARAFSEQFGGTPLALDRASDLSAILKKHRVVVDAAGPFQSYGCTSYPVAQAAIDAGCHYLDLSDDAAFTRNISPLNTKALARNVAVLSGMSSVPALSSAVVTDLAAQVGPLRRIEHAILPGNRAPRGFSVMQAIPALITIGKLARHEVHAGARPALDIFTLKEAETALSRLRASTSRV